MGALLVLAGPGSGKTFTITQRIFYLLEQKHITPEKILVITFTKESALSMQNRFRQQAGQTIPINFGTFHSIFYHILKQSHILQNHQILTLHQKKTIIFPILKKTLSIPKENNIKKELRIQKNYDVSNINVEQEDLSELSITMLAAIGYYKNTGNFEQAAGKLSSEWRELFPEILKRYEEERKRRGGIDFDDMVYECRELLRTNDVLRQYWQERFEAILIDEFQDISPMQYEVVRLLSKEGSIFAVGDDDQSIYGFRGSNPECLKRFVQDYKAEQICLNINYRSRKEIVQAANLVIGENEKRFPKELHASERKTDFCESTEAFLQPASAVRLLPFTERDEEYEYMVNQCRDVLLEYEHGNLQDSYQAGILFRTNTFLQGLAVRLHREGIPYVMKDKIPNIYEHFIVKDIMAYLKIAEGEGSRALFLQIMNKPSRYLSREAVARCNDKSFGNAFFEELIRYYRERDFLEKNRLRFERIICGIEGWQKQMKAMKGLSPFASVMYIRKAMGYEDYLRELTRGDTERWQEWEEILVWISTDASRYNTLQEWFRVQEDYTANYANSDSGKRKHHLENQKEDNKKNTLIHLMTVHASKGLEFDAVYIPDCNEKVFPHGRMPDKETCEEERRIFYVAMTRAKNSLELLYLTGTNNRPRLPSRFLNKLIQNQSSSNSSNSQVSRNSSNASATFSYSASSSI